MSGTAVFQSGTLATPGEGIVIATDAVDGTQYQQVKLDVGPAGTSILMAYGGTGMPLGTLPGGTVGVAGTLQTLGTYQPLAGSVHLASGTVSVLGTFQPLAGSVHPAAALPGTSHITGTVRILDPAAVSQSGAWSVAATLGTLPGGTVQTHGTSQVIGTVQLVGVIPVGTVAGTVSIGTVAGTVQALGSVQAVGTAQVIGTVQPLAGSVHIASGIPGTVQIRGTIDSMPPISIGTISGGTVQAFGTTEVLGTVQAIFAGNVTVGTIAEGTINRIDGTVQIRGTIDSMPPISIGTISGGTIQAFGTTQVIGTVRILDPAAVTQSGAWAVSVTGTAQALGTVQPLAGSVHLATNLAGGTVVIVGSAAHGATADARPVLNGAFGSSGTQVAVADGQATRLWADLNGRLQVRGTIDSMPSITGSVQTVGTIQAFGTTQVIGTVQTTGTVSVGTVAGTVSALGTLQPLAGSVHPAAAIPGTSQISGSVQAVGSLQVRPAGVAGEGFVGTIYAGAAFSTVAIFPNPASGTYVRLFDALINGSAAGTARLEFGSAAGTLVAGVTLADAGGWALTSSRGILSPGTAKGLYLTATAGTWNVMVNYTLEN